MLQYEFNILKYEYIILINDNNYIEYDNKEILDAE